MKSRSPQVSRTSLRRQPRGGVYFAVIGICLLVSVIALGALAAARVQARGSAAGSDSDEARLNARAGIELGILFANQKNFRTNYSNGAWITNQSVASGTFTLEGINPNGPLNNSDTDPVVLTSTGAKGQARHMSQVRLVASPTSLTCLNSAAVIAGAVTLIGGGKAPTSLTTTQAFSSNVGITATSAALNGRLEAVVAITPTLCTGTFTTKIVKPYAMPDATVFDYYKAHGTPIALGSLPTVSGIYTVARVVLSPGNNPYGSGTTNPQGIYVIDCGTLGASVDIRNCRIVGTLVLLNAGLNSKIEGSVNWAPAVSNFPALLVQSQAGGQFGLHYSNAALSEPVLAVNFNPASTPYNGVSNSNVNDTYPSSIQGIIYCSGNLVVDTYATIKGVLLAGGTLTSTTGTVDLSYDTTFADNPPPGFFPTPVKMKASKDTWAQSVN